LIRLTYPSSARFLTFRVALDRIGIGLTYTSKCGIPIITVLLTLLLDGMSALPNMAALLSLIPIALGIAAASWSAPTWETLGFLMAVLSTTAQSLLNVSSKRVLSRAGWSGAKGQRPMVAVGLLMALAWNSVSWIWTLWGSKGVSTAASPQSTTRGRPPLWLTFMAMVSYHVEYLLSFIFVTLVGPVTYGTCDAMRRLGIILFGRIFFGGDPLTRTNQLGIALALLGALGYSIVSKL
jgi:Triose-phosphate Transporter family